ncbi:hypothetical protein [Euzebya tangerina]|uniref:hypothetical protein n=1 Tax=Euzebya tangerina TaxID=591198 RepID=UPI000E323C77|nr:hypothetical protein [Euzebya tangerina]
MEPRDHILAVVDTMEDYESTLGLAKDAIDHGGRATVLVHLGDSDRAHIRQYAASEELALHEAETTYINATLDRVRAFIGADHAAASVTDQVPDGRAVIESAVASEATAITVPSRLVGRRSWRRAMARTPLNVIVTPVAA